MLFFQFYFILLKFQNHGVKFQRQFIYPTELIQWFEAALHCRGIFSQCFCFRNSQETVKIFFKIIFIAFFTSFFKIWSLYLIWKNLTVFWYRDDVVIPVDGHQTIIGEFLLFGKFFKGTKFFMFSCCIGLFEDFLEVPASSRPSILSSLPPPPNPENIVRKNTNKTIIKRFINLKDILFSNFLYCLHQTEKKQQYVNFISWRQILIFFAFKSLRCYIKRWEFLNKSRRIIHY